MAYRLTNEIDAGEGVDGPAGLPTGNTQVNATNAPSTANGTHTSTGGLRVVGGEKIMSRMDEDEERDAVFFRLESLGYRVGQGLVERYVLL